MSDGIEVTHIPAPGSNEATALGCLCPVMDNRHGKGMPYPDGPRFWINAACPLHVTGHPEVITDEGEADDE